MVGGFAKNFGVSIKYVLEELSFVNFMIYSKIEPSIDIDEEPEEEVIDATDPKNNDKIASLTIL